MKHLFPHAEYAPLEIPDGQLSGLYSMRAAGDPADPRHWIAVALANPVGSARLRDRVHPGMKVVVVVDDNTRTTRTDLMLPASRIKERVTTGQLDPIPAAAIWLGTRMLERANVILVSKGVTEAEATAMGLAYASDPSAALALALRQHGPRARINLLYKAAKLICAIP